MPTHTCIQRSARAKGPGPNRPGQGSDLFESTSLPHNCLSCSTPLFNSSCSHQVVKTLWGRGEGAEQSRLSLFSPPDSAELPCSKSENVAAPALPVQGACVLPQLFGPVEENSRKKPVLHKPNTNCRAVVLFQGHSNPFDHPFRSHLQVPR